MANHCYGSHESHVLLEIHQLVLVMVQVIHYFVYLTWFGCLDEKGTTIQLVKEFSWLSNFNANVEMHVQKVFHNNIPTLFNMGWG